MENNCSILIDQTLKECDELLRDGKIHEILHRLYTIEDETRIVRDVIANGKIILSIVQYCYKAQQWNLLAKHVIRYSQMSNQSQQIEMKIVQYLKSCIEEINDVKIKIKLIEILQKTSSPSNLKVESTNICFKKK
ncbi:unnamed protein product [Rotaria magnacalcarata]|uniref:PSMD12/CSN4-like N-terminal domain-containing protein n=1 Tax=Rotaria magnacalcarata TaxID=392030 RepID=A0A819VBE8_9BILA|nr:unnamed protein product [Rotaria magnacalcarata]